MRWLALPLAVWLSTGCLGTTANPAYDPNGGGNRTPGLDGGGDGGPNADGGPSGDGGKDAEAGAPDGGGEGDACTKVAWYPDEDDDDLGSGEARYACDEPAMGDWADNNDDTQPRCESNDNQCTPLAQQCSGGDTWQICSEIGGCTRWVSYMACGLGGRVCGASEGTCVACKASSQCGEMKPVCTSDNRCVECLDSMHCQGKGDADICKDEVCVECLGDGDCDGGLHCDAQGQCVACLEDGHCDAGAPVCDDGECVGCGGPGDCSRFGTTPVCDAADDGACVECLPGDAELCGGQTPYCADDGRECVACNDHGDCTDPAAARCEGHVCVPCSTSEAESGCADVEREGRPAEVCVAAEGGNLCVECGQDSDCDVGPMDMVDGDEVCTERYYCADGGVGSAALCEPCYDDRQCPEGGVCIAVGEASEDVTPVGECFPKPVGPDLKDCVEPGYREPVTANDVVGVSAAHCVPLHASCEESLRFNSFCKPNEVADPLCLPPGASAGYWSVECDSFLDCPVDDPDDLDQWKCEGDLCKLCAGPC